jgi:hypothetical protein
MQCLYQYPYTHIHDDSTHGQQPRPGSHPPDEQQAAEHAEAVAVQPRQKHLVGLIRVIQLLPRGRVQGNVVRQPCRVVRSQQQGLRTRCFGVWEGWRAEGQSAVK